MTNDEFFSYVYGVLEEVVFQNYMFLVTKEGDNFFLKASFTAPCNKTGALETHKTRKWRLSKHMVKSEIVQTAFKLVLTSIEHEAREQFTYKGMPIFGPHYDVDVLVDVMKAGKSQDERG